MGGDRRYSGACRTYRARVTWYQPLAVTGAPRLALTIGSATKHGNCDADASRPNGLGSGGHLVFAYTVALGDSDTDGIAVPGPVDPNGSSIAVGEGDFDAQTGLGRHMIADDANHLVDARTDVNGIRIRSNPPDGAPTGSARRSWWT